jgi:DNA-directed RNA polymerase subunit RPC12/RpoP
MLSAVVAAAGAMLVALLVNRFESDVSTFVGTAVAPLLWLVATCFIWRESPEERAARLSDASRGAIVCPNCGYNLTGLSGTRCPECGKQYTINELLAEQPTRAAAEVETG